MGIINEQGKINMTLSKLNETERNTLVQKNWAIAYALGVDVVIYYIY